jgi:hypothetical protein
MTLYSRVNNAARLAILLCAMTLITAPAMSNASAPDTVPNFPTAAAARAWSESEEHAGNFALASSGYYREAAIRRELGDEQAAEVEELRASRLATSVQFAVSVPTGPRLTHYAKLEPRQGCYIGVRDEGDGNADSFVDRLGRPISIAYNYLSYGAPFPTNWATRQAAQQRAIQIAWEPANIYAVTDDRYLEDFARDVSRCGTGVFIRFGGEMNGFWATWGRDPAAYVAAFRTVHDVMARIAPNAAMVWAPNQIPVANLDEYYPGDRYVDWVGISLYTVRYYDDDLSRPAYNDSPVSMIEPFYRKFAARKPLCIAECGISRRSHIENADADEYAASRLTDLMNALRVRFPRLKMICFFDQNNLTRAAPNRRLNDYSLPDGSLVLSALRQATGDPYFISQYTDGISSSDAYQLVSNTLPADYIGSLIASIVTYDLHPRLQLKQGNQTQFLDRPYIGEVASGHGLITATVNDSHGKIAAKVAIDGR